MLSPSITNAQSLLTQAFNEVLRLDGYASNVGSIRIGTLPDDPGWLASVRSRVAMLASAGAAWTASKPDIWGAVLLQFTDYAAAFSGVASRQASGTTSAGQWITLLQQVLLPQLDTAVKATRAADAALQADYQKFRDIQPLLADSINQGWQALGDEEAQMVAIAGQLVHLQDVVASLSQSITGDEISTGKSVTTTTVTMLYNVATAAGGSFSFLSMATAAFTVGKMYYDIIEGTAEVNDTLQQIATLQLEASEEAQAAAGTKMVLQLLYSLELSFGAISDVLPQIQAMWENEQQKVQALVEALQAGGDPALEFEIVSMPAANANWQAINHFALLLPALRTQVGTPVTLNPQAPITAPS